MKLKVVAKQPSQRDNLCYQIWISFTEEFCSKNGNNGYLIITNPNPKLYTNPKNHSPNTEIPNPYHKNPKKALKCDKKRG